MDPVPHKTRAGDPPEPSDTRKTSFTVNVSGGEEAYIQELVSSGCIIDAHRSRAGLTSLTVSFNDDRLYESTPGQPLLRNEYPPGLFEERVLPGLTKLPPDPVDYQLETHPIHAYCLESSRVSSIVAERFPQISDPVILNLVAGLMVTSTEAPSLGAFQRCFRVPLEGISEKDIQEAYSLVQEARPSRSYILRNALSTFESTRRRSTREVCAMHDTVYNPWDDVSDRFNVMNVMAHGLTVTVKKDVLEGALAKTPIEGSCPSAERLKLEKLFSVEVDHRHLNDNSKLALSAHDTFDHMFFFDLIQKTGLAEKFLPSIANLSFSTRDNIFSLASEYLAMVAYDWRAWQEFGLAHNRPISSIVEAGKQTLRAGLESGEVPQAARKTVESFLALPENDERVQQFGFTLRGIQWENGEMSIKWGSLDLRPLQTANDPHTEPWGPTPILQHPAYLAFVICGLEALNDPKNGALEAMQRINFTLEHHISEAAKHYAASDTPYQFTLKLGDLRSAPAPEVSQAVREWFYSHIGFAAVRAPLCNQ